MGNLRVVTRLVAGLKWENHRPNVAGGGIQANPAGALSARRRNGDRCMSTRTLLRLTFLAGLAAPVCAFALGVGPLAVRSALNENLDADVPLVVSNPGELMGLTVRIPQQQDFDRAGVERLATFSKLRVSVQTPPGGPNLIKITSTEPVRNPNFNLLLELVWPRGRLIREFTVQLDPELYANRRPPPPPPPPAILPAPAAAAAPAAAPPPRPALNLPPAPQVSLEGASTYGPIKAGETLSGIANRAQAPSGISTPQMMAILLAANPQAFTNGNPNALRKGAVLRVPSAQAVSGQSAAEAAAPAVSDLSVPPSAAPLSPPAAPDVAAAPPPPAVPGPVTPTSGPVSAQTPAVPLPPPLSPPPVPTPPSVVGTPSVVPPVALTPSSLPVGQQPQEIVPQASIPQAPATSPTATSGSTVTATATATATPPPNTATGTVTPPSGTAVTPATPPVESPKPVAPAPVKPPVQPVVEPEPSWFDNPVIWLGGALILLAIAALVLLPLLRRSARSSPATVEPVTEPVTGRPSAAQTAASPAADSPTRVVRPLDPAIVAALAPPAPAVAAPEPSSVSNLLRDIDLGVSNLPLSASDTAPQLIDRRTPLPDREPATASEHEKPSIPAMTLAKPSEPAQKSPARAELPTELQFGGMDFDFGDMKLQQTGSQPVELAPLEMKPAISGAKAGGLAPVPIDRMEPATEPASSSGAAMAAILAADETFAMELKPGHSADQTLDLDIKSRRSQPSELLPLEMMPLRSDQELLNRLPQGIDHPEPVTEPGTFSGVSAILSAQSAADAEASRAQVKQPPSPVDHKFDFADITQEVGRQTDDISLTKLDEDLRSFGDKTLDLAPMEVKSSPVMPENAMADYMETKLDLAMAYLDMGDQMGARSLLETVLQEGDSSQKQRANDILKKIA